ncbi:MAG: hypothetical protein WCP12_07375 [bacterium]
MEFTEIREEDDIEALDEGPKTGFLGSLFKGLLIVAGLFLLTLGLLPTILSSDASRKWALARVNAEIAPREVTIGQWSFGWFSAPAFEKIDLFDAENGVTFKADSIKLEKGLIRMLPFGKWKVGRMTVMRPDLTITQLEKKESGIKKDVDERVASSKKGCPFLVSDLSCTLVVEKGKVAVNTSSGTGSAADQITAEIAISSLLDPVNIQTKMRIGTGTVSVDGSILSPVALASGKTSTKSEKLKVKLQQLDLSLFSSILRMMKTPLWVESGIAEGELSLTVAGLNQVKISGGILVNAFSVAGEKLKASPKAELALMTDLDYSNREVTIKTLDFASPWLRTRAKGQLQLGSKDKKTTGALSVTSESDVKAIVRDFGPMLGITPELTLQSGHLNITVNVEGDEQGTVIDANLTIDDLLMKLAGEPILLKPAPSLMVKARLPHDSRIPEISDLRLRAPFADISARGKLENGKIDGTINLTAFSRDFRRIFKKLPTMVGAIAFKLETQQAESRVSLISTLTVSDLAAEFKPGERTIIQQGTLKSSAFILTADGTSVVENMSFALNLPGGQLLGQCKRFAMNKIEDQGKEVSRPSVRGLSLSSEFELPALRQWVGPFLSDDVRRKMADAVGQIVMNATADIAKGEAKVLMNAAGQRISVTQSNRVVKIPDIRMNASVTQTKPNAAFQVKGDLLGSIAILREKETLFAEKDTKIIVDMVVAPDFERLEIKSLDIASDILGFRGKADLSELKSRCVVAVEGQSTLDCERLTMLLDAQGVDNWTLTGRAARPFTFKAPLAGGINTLFAEGQMDCAVAIASAQGMGLKAGASDASLKLSDGRMTISYGPALNQGKLKLNPMLTLERNNLMCTVPPKTRMLENVQLNQEMLDGLFMKLFPIFKGSLAQNGSVTLDVNAFNFISGLPIEQGCSAEFALQLKDVKVIFGETLRDLLTRLGSKTTVWEQQQVLINAQVKNGRIILDPVTLVVDKHPITFSGWVDSKGAINYMIEVTLTERMLGKYGGSAIGKVVKVPVTGTVNAPKIEMNALLQALAPAAAEILREEVQDHAKNFLESLRKEMKKK